MNDLTDPIELLMRRQGLTEPEAIEQYRAIQRRKQIAAALVADPAADVATMLIAGDDQAEGEGEGIERADGQGVNAETTPDMGVREAGPTSATAPPAGAQPNVSVAVAVDPRFPIPAAPLILPATPGYGSWGTEQ
jgi:hypothetical protein